jgi:hypothetical protein
LKNPVSSTRQELLKTLIGQLPREIHRTSDEPEFLEDSGWNNYRSRMLTLFTRRLEQEKANDQ